NITEVSKCSDGNECHSAEKRRYNARAGLEHVATWNSGMLRSNDLMEAIKAFWEKR
ncbi:hypothetical protein CFC21_049519, partial [Triticum aestivum]